MVVVDKVAARILRGGHPAPETSSGHVQLRHGDTYAIALRNFNERDAVVELKIDSRVMGLYLVPAKSKLVVDSPKLSDAGIFTFFKANTETGKDLREDDQQEHDLGLIEAAFTLFKYKTADKRNDIEKRLQETLDSIKNWPQQSTTIVIDRDYNWWYRRPYWTRPWWDQSPVIYCGTAPSTLNASVTGGSASGQRAVYTNATGTVLCSSMGGVSFSASAQHTPDVSQVTRAGITGLTGESDKMYEDVPDDLELDEDSQRTILLRLVAVDEVPKTKPKKLPRGSSPYPEPVEF